MLKELMNKYLPQGKKKPFTPVNPKKKSPIKKSPTKKPRRKVNAL